jgi:hypothetical protein
MRETTPRTIAEQEIAVVRAILERVPFKPIPRAGDAAPEQLVPHESH